VAQPLDLADQAPSPDGRAVLHASLTSSRSCSQASVGLPGPGLQHVAATLCCQWPAVQLAHRRWWALPAPGSRQARWPVPGSAS